MLDAAEELLRQGGSDAVTVEAVIERAGTSTGAFYARFGSRQGLLVAMHERFLATFREPLIEAATEALERHNLRDAMHTFVEGVVVSVRRHRNTCLFHTVHNAHEADMRAQGNELTQGLALLVERIVDAHRTDAVPMEVDRVDMTSRVLHAFALQLMLFDDDEVTGKSITVDQMIDHLTDMCVSYLTQT